MYAGVPVHQCLWDNEQKETISSHLIQTELHQLTIIIHNSGLLLATVHREADNLHLHKGINDLADTYNQHHHICQDSLLQCSGLFWLLHCYTEMLPTLLASYLSSVSQH